MEISELIVAVTMRPVSARLIRAIMEEFGRNGGRTLSPGKLRHLRRVSRRRRSR